MKFLNLGGLTTPEKVREGRHRPANDAAAPGVHNDREIQEAGPRTDVRDVGYPELIRPVSREISIDQVSSHLPIAITVGGSTPFATTYTLQACSTHQARNALATDPLPLGYKFLVYARDTTGAVRTLVYLHDPFRQSRIGLCSWRQRPLEPRVVPTGGDFQDPAHRGYFI